jgi:hypothetical protein
MCLERWSCVVVPQLVESLVLLLALSLSGAEPGCKVRDQGAVCDFCCLTLITAGLGW